MIEKLRRIVTRVAEAPDLALALEHAVWGIRDAMSVDACMAFLVDPTDDCLVLVEVAGYERSEIGLERLAPGEGVVGLVRELRAPLTLRDASAHARFRPFAASDPGWYRGFLGVPMVHRGRVLGVLVVCRRRRRRFGARQEAFLVAAATQLAGTLAPSLNQSQGLLQAARGPRSGFVQGIAGAPGVAVGEIVVPSPLAELDAVEDRPAADAALEESAFRKAVTAVRAELIASGERMQGLLPEEVHELFDVYAMLVSDEGLAARVVERIRDGLWAPAALRDAVREHADVLEGLQDDRLAARAEDIRAVGRRLLLELHADARSPGAFPARTVLLGDEVSLARIADVPRERLAGIACVKGSVLSHTAVVARALGVPAVMGLGDLGISQLPGRTVVIDGYLGRVLLDPAPAVVREFERLERDERALASELEGLRGLPAQTLDGVRLSLHVNTGLLADIESGRSVDPAGVGLYRSEFPFMLRNAFPSEAEQCEIYRRMLQAFAPRPVVMRTLDIGGDKPLDYFPIAEANPLLGWRGIRVTLQRPQIFLTQLRAMLQASVGLDNLQLLLPMVSVPREVREARSMLAQAIESLVADGLQVRPPPLGVMLEVPLALFALDEMGEFADFFSVGTNDLTQYLTAVDRGNPRVAGLYDHLDPAVLRVIRQAVVGASALGKPISVCGELAGDPVGALLLLGMGLHSLSTAPAALPRVKWVVRSVTRARAREVLEQALTLPDAAAVRSHGHDALEAAGLGGLIRPGR